MTGWSRLWRFVVALTVVCALLPAVASAASGWALQSIPAPTSAFPNSLDGVSCESAGACTAVGDWLDKRTTPTRSPRAGTGPAGRSSQSRGLAAPPAPSYRRAVSCGEQLPRRREYEPGRRTRVHRALERNEVDRRIRCEHLRRVRAERGVVLLGERLHRGRGRVFERGGVGPGGRALERNQLARREMPNAPGGNLLYTRPALRRPSASPSGKRSPAARSRRRSWSSGMGRAARSRDTESGQTGKNTQLEAVSCSSPTACAAVGGTTTARACRVARRRVGRIALEVAGRRIPRSRARAAVRGVVLAGRALHGGR